MTPKPARDPVLDGLEGLLAHPQLVRIALVGAALLTLPALFQPFVLDDYVLGVLSRNHSAVAGFAERDPFPLFRFTLGVPENNLALMAEGVLLPWWTDVHHLNAFFRPLSSLSHHVDFGLFPDSALLMHVHSGLWFFALLWAAWGLYRSVHGPKSALAAVCLLLFAWDDPHGATLGWIANRNALIAGALALPAVTWHRRATLEGHATGIGRWLVGPAWFSAGLLAGEAAIGVLGYVLAHALLLERGSVVRRLARLTPYALVLLAWRAIYRIQGLGSSGSGAYHDPIGEPGAFVRVLAQNLPVLLGAQHGPPYADAAFWGPPDDRPLLVLFSLLVLGVATAIAWPVLRARPEARFYALGSLLSAVPVSASLPGERLLLLVGVGGSGLAALVLCHYLARAREEPLAKLVAVGLFGLHVVAAGAALPVWSASMGWVGRTVARAERDLPDAPDVRSQTFIIVNAPFDVLASYIQPMRAYLGVPRPRHLQWLATASSPLTVTCVGPRTLEIRSKRGILHSPQAKHYRRDMAGLRAGARVELPAMTVDILAAEAEGGPTHMRYTFRQALGSPRLALFLWQDGALVPYAPSAFDPPLELPQQDLFEIVLATLLKHP